MECCPGSIVVAERHAAAAGQCLRNGPAPCRGCRDCHENRQPYVPGDGHHGLPEERRHARERRGDGQSRVNAHDTVL